MPTYPPDRWEAMSDLFAEALARPAPERAAFLTAACTGDPALRTDVERLLAAHAEAESTGRFERGALALLPDALAEAAPPPHVGPYRLLREVGRGGMGAVWLAERADGVYRQRVAVKLLRPGLLGEDGRRRFRAERRILARLDHPHIARILDGGVADGAAGGRPYLVMEYVEGEPITAYAARTGLGVEARLALFRQACEAVAYAHRNLVVHRDLKPSNLFVTEGDGGPAVKLLDFGIAKLLDTDAGDDAGDDAPFTRAGATPMTPEYAAPEQVRGEPVAPAADVYALGVVLFELLTGARPYRLAGLSAAGVEAVVCRTDPPRASQAPPGEGGPPLAPERLARRLRGDLDTIVAKALRKEPERRYATAAELAEDLRRHASGLPVSARPDTAGYRARKFVGRHRAGVAATAVVALALVAALGVSLAQTRAATAERARAEAVNAFLQEMLASPDPFADGPEVRVVDVLDRSGAALSERFQRRPDVEAALRLTLGNSYFELGRYDPGAEHLERAVALYTARPAGDGLAEALATLGALRQRQGDLDAADALMTRALDADRARHGPAHRRTAARLADLGALRWTQGDYDAAEPLVREALRVLEAVGETGTAEHARALGSLATIRVDQGHPDEAEALYREELALLRSLHGDRHPHVPQALSHIAIIRADLEDFEQAKTLHAEALALFRQIRGEQHPDVSYAMANLGTVEISLGNYARADSLLSLSIALDRLALGKDHPSIGIRHNNIGSIRRRQGDVEGALAAYREALAVWRAGLPADHPYLAQGLQNMGSLLLAEGRVREALPVLRECYLRRAEHFAEGHTARANAASLYGAALARSGGPRVEAESLLVRGHAVLLAELGAEHSATQNAAARVEAFHAGRTAGR